MTEFVDLYGGPCDGEVRMIEFDIDTILVHHTSYEYKYISKKEVLIYKRKEKDSSIFEYDWKL